MLASRLVSNSARGVLAGSFRTTVQHNGRRFISIGPGAPPKKSSWKGLFARWGIAGGALYLYSTSGSFREEANAGLVPPRAFQIPAKPQVDPQESFQSARDIALERQRKSAEAAAAAKAQSDSEAEAKAESRSRSDAEPENVGAEETRQAGAQEESQGESEEEGSPLFASDLEQNASQQGAFNEETGEINWDCPCLGGMAHGPCGEEFKSAFSCFVFSKEEQKGIDCVDKFRAMQTCFRQYPDVYGDELEPEEGDENGNGERNEIADAGDQTLSSASTTLTESAPTSPHAEETSSPDATS